MTTDVHITDNRFCCQSGYCDAMFSCSKRHVVKLDKTDILCPHLVRMKDQRDLWTPYLPEAVDSEGAEISNEIEDEPEDDVPPPRPAEVPITDMKVIIIYVCDKRSR